MATFYSPEAGEIEAFEIFTAAAWLMHRYTHELYGERAIVRQLTIGGATSFGDGIVAQAWLGAPVPGAGALDWYAIDVYEIPT